MVVLLPGIPTLCCFAFQNSRRDVHHIERHGARYQIPDEATGEWPQKPLPLPAVLVGGVEREEGATLARFPKVRLTAQGRCVEYGPRLLPAAEGAERHQVFYMTHGKIAASAFRIALSSPGNGADA
jgi:hypothetical protein